MAVEEGLIRKSGAWYTHEGDQLGQGKENARSYLKDNPELTNELERQLKEKMGVGAAKVDLAVVPVSEDE
jgi:recombination protein RecA